MTFQIEFEAVNCFLSVGFTSYAYPCNVYFSTTSPKLVRISAFIIEHPKEKTKHVPDIFNSMMLTILTILAMQALTFGSFVVFGKDSKHRKDRVV
jgi:hypothetical protein